VFGATVTPDGSVALQDYDALARVIVTLRIQIGRLPSAGRHGALARRVHSDNTQR